MIGLLRFVLGILALQNDWTERKYALGDKAGPVLFQLPPNFMPMPNGWHRSSNAVEETPLQFRISSSKLVHATDTQTAIRSKHLALPFGSSRRAGPWKRTADFVYIRGHGPGGRYKGHYRPAALAEWSHRIGSWKNQGCDVFVYFDNDQKSAAPADALKLRLLLER